MKRLITFEVLAVILILCGCSKDNGTVSEDKAYEKLTRIVCLNDTSDEIAISEVIDESYDLDWFNMDALHVVIKATGESYLYDSYDNELAGPYTYIEDEINFSWDRACRYMDSNGMIGYLNRDGSKITEPKFITASKMEDGRAMVSEEEGKIYYIDINGERFTKDYIDGFPFEHQGFWARVKTENGWGIINRNDELVFDGASNINELPLIDVLGSAMRDGKIVLFDLREGENGFMIYREIDGYNSVSPIYYGSFAIVKNAENMYGVIDYKGDLIITDRYKSIEYKIVDDGDDYWYGDHVVFSLYEKDGSKKEKEVRIGEGLVVGDI